jgi:hypothetical protein
MLTFIIFLIAVALYALFLLWCFAPLLRRAKRRWLGWLRVVFGGLLLGSNFVPPLAWPIIIPTAMVSTAAADLLMAVIHFPYTLPMFVANVQARASATATATVIDINYPIEIAGVRYAPTVRTACTSRKMFTIDKGLEIHTFAEYLTASGGELVARAGEALIALDQTDNLCSMARAGRLQPGTFPDFRTRIGVGPWIYIVRGEADQTQLYQLEYHRDAVAVDDIVLQPPQIVRIEPTAAREVIALDALWPMNRRGEMSRRTPWLIEAYRGLPAGVNGCVLDIIASMDFRTMNPTVSRWQKTRLDHIAPWQRPAYCRDALGRRIPHPTLPQLASTGS